MVEQIGLEAVLKDENFTKGLAKYVKGVNTANTTTTKASTSMSQKWASLGKGVLSFAGTVSKALVTGIGAGVAALGAITIASTKVAISFESAFAGVIKTTDGLTDEFGNLTVAGKEMQTQFRDLAQDIPLAVEELLEIGELGGQLGVAKDDLIGFTEAIAAMGVATNLSTEEAATGFAQLANIMGTVEREGTDAFSKLGSTIVALGNNSATTERDILSFATRIAGAGKIAGLNEANLFAIGAAFSSIGVQAEAGGTAVQKVLLEMTQAVVGGVGTANEEMVGVIRGWVKETGSSVDTIVGLWLEGEQGIEDFASSVGVSVDRVGEVIAGMGTTTDENLKKFAEISGVTADEFVEMWEGDAVTAFQLFVEGLGAQGEDAITTLQDLGLTDSRLTKAFLSLAGAGGVLSDSINLAGDAWDENTALTKEAEQRYATTESQLILLKNQIIDVGISIGSVLLPYLNEMVAVAGPIIREYGEKLVPVLKQVFQWIGENLPIAINTLTIWWTDILLPALVSFWSFVQDSIIPVLQTLWTWLGETLPKAIAFVTEHWNEFKAALIAIGAVLAVVAIITAIGAAIAALSNPIFWIIAAIGLLAAAWEGDWGGMRTLITAWWEETGKPIFTSISNWLSIHIPAAIATVSTWWTETFIPALQEVWGFISEDLIPMFMDLWSILTVEIPAAINTSLTFWKTLWSFIKTGVIAVFQTLIGKWESLKTKFQESGFIDNLKTVFEGLIKTLQGVLGLVNNIVSALGKIKSKTVTITIKTIKKTITKDDDDGSGGGGGPSPFARGGVLRGLGVVGEQGPELVSSNTGVRIFPNDTFKKFNDFMRSVGRMGSFVTPNQPSLVSSPISNSTTNNNQRTTINIQGGANIDQIRFVVEQVINERMVLNS